MPKQTPRPIPKFEEIIGEVPTHEVDLQIIKYSLKYLKDFKAQKDGTLPQEKVHPSFIYFKI